MLKTQQIELKWALPQNLSVRDFRRNLGAALASRPIPDGWDRFFNHAAGEASQPRPALFRFFTRQSDFRPCAGVTIVGEDACRWACTNLFPLLDAMKTDLSAGTPEINNGTIYWERRPERVRAVKIVLRSKKIARGANALAPYHANPMLFAPHLAHVLAEGINRQADLIGLGNPHLDPTEIEVEHIHEIGCQPVQGCHFQKTTAPTDGA